MSWGTDAECDRLHNCCVDAEREHYGCDQLVDTDLHKVDGFECS